MIHRRSILAGLFAVAGWFAAAVPSRAAAGEPVPGEWRHVDQTVHYYGFTTTYSCDAMEARVTQILRHLGARKDLKVVAQGCASGPLAQYQGLWIHADFYALRPAGADTRDPVPAHWVEIGLKPQHPNFMEEADCELVSELKPLLVGSFGLNPETYTTNCQPNTFILNSYAVQGRVLEPLKKASGG